MRNVLITLKDFFLGGKQRKPHASNLLIVTSPREPKEVGNNADADAKEKECLGKQYKVQTVSQGQHLWKYHIAYRIQWHSYFSLNNFIVSIL